MTAPVRKNISPLVLMAVMLAVGIVVGYTFRSVEKKRLELDARLRDAAAEFASALAEASRYPQR